MKSMNTTLENRGILTVQQLQTHCKGTNDASCWISLCNDASWMLGYINRLPLRIGCWVAIISLPKLDRLNILWDRSDILVRQAGGNYYKRHEDGVQNVWAGHYLVYGWIPAQCVA